MHEATIATVNPDLAARRRELRTPRVVIVDDAPELRAAVHHRLETGNCRPAAFATGRAALEALADLDPDVLLIDLRLDDLPGLVVMTEARKLCPCVECIVLNRANLFDSSLSISMTE